MSSFYACCAPTGFASSSSGNESSWCTEMQSRLHLCFAQQFWKQIVLNWFITIQSVCVVLYWGSFHFALPKCQTKVAWLFHGLQKSEGQQNLLSLSFQAVELFGVEKFLEALVQIRWLLRGWLEMETVDCCWSPLVFVILFHYHWIAISVQSLSISWVLWVATVTKVHLLWVHMISNEEVESPIEPTQLNLGWNQVRRTNSARRFALCVTFPCCMSAESGNFLACKQKRIDSTINSVCSHLQCTEIVPRWSFQF